MIITESGKKLYSYDDVASLMGVTPQTVRRYAAGLEMPLLPVSGKLYFEECQILQIIEARKAPKPEKRGRKKKTASK